MEIEQLVNDINEHIDIPNMTEEDEKKLLTFIFTLFIILIYISIYIYKKQELPILEKIQNLFK
jgi:hypothetical protein